MRITRLLFFTVIILALLNVLPAMGDLMPQKWEPKTYKTDRMKCITFNRVTPSGSKPRRLRLQTCDFNNQTIEQIADHRSYDPDQWIFIRKINKDEGVFYNYAGNQIIGFNARKNNFQIIDTKKLYRGRGRHLSCPGNTGRGRGRHFTKNCAVYKLRRRLEREWRKHEKCKPYKCTTKLVSKIRNRIRRLLRNRYASSILSQRDAEYIINRPRLKVRHPRKKSAKIASLFFNLQEKMYANGYYQIRVRVNEVEIPMRHIFM